MCKDGKRTLNFTPGKTIVKGGVQTSLREGLVAAPWVLCARLREPELVCSNRANSNSPTGCKWAEAGS